MAITTPAPRLDVDLVGDLVVDPQLLNIADIIYGTGKTLALEGIGALVDPLGNSQQTDPADFLLV